MAGVEERDGAYFAVRTVGVDGVQTRQEFGPFDTAEEAALGASVLATTIRDADGAVVTEEGQPFSPEFLQKLGLG